MDKIRHKILIVDDTPRNLQLLGNTLKEQKYQVEFAIDGINALDWIGKTDFDLILLDIMMPGMNGYELCKNIRKIKRYRKIPIIFLTAKTDPDSIVAGFEAGAQDYITKPFNTVELLLRVKTQLDLKSSREKLESMNEWLDSEVKKRTDELRVANQELEKANKEMKGLDKAKSDFLNIISHEIRTPLNGIVGPLEMVKKKTGTEKLGKLFNMLDTSVQRLENFSLTALQITRMKTNEPKLDLNTVNLEMIFDQSLQALNEKILQKDLMVEKDLVADHHSCLADQELLYMAISRVMENAVAHSPDGGKINISTRPENDWMQIEITDQGSGFPDVILGQDFGLFNTGEEHIDKNMGLDLNLVKLIIEKHGGEILFYNEKKDGAGIRISLPAY